ncbi:MucR family transcriptional regulator [Komagataeibacter nataicola]|nr:MucR family transcriptional regulator [Komagataeibacter nataicola]PYD66277.1 MucR family transcriptional regulator [Komagataeibacter nataicola]
MMDADKLEVIKCVTEIVVSYVSKNTLPVEEVPAFINKVYDTLEIAGGNKKDEPSVPALVPAVPIKKSVFPDYIVCLEDGKKLKMLKRHLNTAYGMTPEEYRAKWGLPESYPMVAPAYSERRTKLAKEIGLGRSIKKQQE